MLFSSPNTAYASAEAPPAPRTSLTWPKKLNCCAAPAVVALAAMLAAAPVLRWAPVVTVGMAAVAAAVALLAVLPVALLATTLAALVALLASNKVPSGGRVLPPVPVPMPVPPPTHSGRLHPLDVLLRVGRGVIRRAESAGTLHHLHLRPLQDAHGFQLFERLDGQLLPKVRSVASVPRLREGLSVAEPVLCAAHRPEPRVDGSESLVDKDD
mmetsp:Transcript_7293/g.11455  ORF Transcript_7293/g.11455 Transcript_7293/m.11455 type:complete len:212 (+) Transcript_7293:1054-1689(+)